MSAVAIVPVKRLSEAKTRLAGVLGGAERRELALRLLETVLGSLRASGCVEAVLVVTPDAEVARFAEARGGTPVVVEAPGLNAALGAATRGAAAGREACLVVLGDLPRLGAGDVREMFRLLDEGVGAVAAPDRRCRGTNLLLQRPAGAFPYRFGPDSYRAHVAAAWQAGVPLRTYLSPGTSFDVDTPDDLAELRAGGDAPLPPAWRHAAALLQCGGAYDVG